MAKTIEDYQRDYQVAKAAGDTAGMDAAHAAADALRGETTSTVTGANGVLTQVGVNSGQLYTMTDQNGTQNWSNKNTQQGVADQSYKGSYSKQIDSMLNNILNRQSFEYNYETDPLYQMYAQQYERNGQRAMEDTLGQVSARTGGMASSYATTASQQAYNNYMDELSGKIPELYQIAYNRYMNEQNMDISKLGLLNDLDATGYNRYRDNIGDQKWQQEFDTSKNQWQQEFDYQKTVDDWNMKFQEDSTKFDQMMNKWQLTGIATSDIADYFGVDVGASTADYGLALQQLELQRQELELQKKKASSKSSSSKSSSSSSSADSSGSTGTSNSIAEITAQVASVLGSNPLQHTADRKQAAINVIESAYNSGKINESTASMLLDQFGL